MSLILVIDDDEGVRKTLKHILTTAGHEVTLASDGVEGLAALAQCRASIVLTDILMPRMDGLSTILRIRAEHPGIRVVAMSGGQRMGRADILKAAAEIGACQVIAKPFVVSELLGVLEHSNDAGQ